MFVAASPCLALAAMINWDLFALGTRGGVVGVVDAKTVAAGIFIGLGAATKLYPLFFLGPAARAVSA